MDIGLALHPLLEGDAPVDAELAGVEGQSQDVGAVADFAEQIFDGVVADLPAAGGHHDAGRELAAPGRDRDMRLARRVEPRADRAAGEGQNEDGIDVLHGEGVHRRIGFVRARLGVDDLDVPPGRLGRLGRAADHVDVQRVIGQKCHDAEGFGVGSSAREQGASQSCGSEKQFAHVISYLLPCDAALAGQRLGRLCPDRQAIPTGSDFWQVPIAQVMIAVS